MSARKIPALVLALALLCACAAPAGENSPAPTAAETAEAVILTNEESAEQCAQVILNSQSDKADYAALPPAEVEFYLSEVYGIPEDCRDLAAVIYTVGGVDGREIAVLWGTNSTQSYAAAAAFADYRRSRAGDFTGYAPKQAALVENGLVIKGNVTLLLLCADPDAAQKALKEKLSPLVIEPFDPEEPPEAYDWTDYLDEKGRMRFDPPNEYDMTPYDTTAIILAWESGERDWLGEKDAAILAKCEEILDECVTGDMTDFEKELAIHDWLIDNVAYDDAVFSAAARKTGRPDNLNPYGALVNGCAICLGYATAFQLLLELCEVECVTVVGATNNSSGDHAWNMVKLDGEWYCVDVTWDYPNSDDPVPPRVRHRYFNVTSDYLRERDHQWGYDNVPEATATRCRWDGTGAPPQ